VVRQKVRCRGERTIPGAARHWDWPNALGRVRAYAPPVNQMSACEIAPDLVSLPPPRPGSRFLDALSRPFRRGFGRDSAAT